VFLDDGDHRLYLELLREASQPAGVRVWAYCLMPNHVHLIAVGEDRDSMARGIGNAHRRYSRRCNQREGWTGHLWANRFYSTPLDDVHLWVAARYVKLNPVRARLVQRAEDYPWSSARAHALGAPDALLAGDRPFPGSVEDWSAWLRAGAEDSRFDEIRSNTSTGRPTGSEAFVRTLEDRLGRVLRPQRRGRKLRQRAGP
jgi:putative transposase